MGLFPMNSLGQFIACKDGNASENSSAPSLITAAGTGDATKVTGQTIDRKPSSGIGLANSAVVATGYLAALTATKTLSLVVATGYLAALTATKTLSLAHEVQYSDDGSTWDTAVAIEASTVKATGEAGGSNERGVDEHSIDLMSQKRYFRINVTPDLSNTATDTALFFTVVALGGYEQIPQ